MFDKIHGGFARFDLALFVSAVVTKSLSQGQTEANSKEISSTVQTLGSTAAKMESDQTEV